MRRTCKEKRTVRTRGAREHAGARQHHPQGRMGARARLQATVQEMRLHLSGFWGWFFLLVPLNFFLLLLCRGGAEICWRYGGSESVVWNFFVNVC
jgi:hypothetical protein